MDLDGQVGPRAGRVGEGQRGESGRIAIPGHRRDRRSCLRFQADVIRQLGQGEAPSGSVGSGDESRAAVPRGRVFLGLDEQPLAGEDGTGLEAHVQAATCLEALPAVLDRIPEPGVTGVDAGTPGGRDDQEACGQDLAQPRPGDRPLPGPGDAPPVVRPRAPAMIHPCGPVAVRQMTRSNTKAQHGSPSAMHVNRGGHPAPNQSRGQTTRHPLS